MSKARGVLTFADMCVDKKGLKLNGIKPFLPYIDYFMPSETESIHLTGCTDCRRAAAIFRDAGTKNVIIKLGGRGVYAECDGFSGFARPFDITPTDTTGSGDAFCAGFIHSMLNGKTTKECLDFASACGAFNRAVYGRQHVTNEHGCNREFY